MNYQIIIDEVELKSFIQWLPDLEPDETFYCCLFARSKYTKGITHIASGKQQLARFTSNKERLFAKISQLEVPLGVYKQKTTVIPQEALALYITINPRSFTKATEKGIMKLMKLVLSGQKGYNPHQEMMSEIQKAKSKTRYVSFDFDVEKDKINEIIEKHVSKSINKDSYNIVETRGGFHLIVNTSKIASEYFKTWYTKTRAILYAFSSDYDNAGDIMLPVPGTYQGGFTPKFIKI